MQLFKQNIGSVDMTEAAFNALPLRILDLLAFYGAQHQSWRNKRTGEYGVTIYLHPAALPALERAWREEVGNVLAG